MSFESDLLETALSAADAAAAIHVGHVGRVHAESIREKGTADFVSHVDLEAQDAALRIIRKRFPDHRIVSEEEHSESSSSTEGWDAPIWIVDPLDGTTNFLHRHPAYAASVGVAVSGEPIAGAVVASATSERWWAARGQGAFRNGERIHVSDVRELRMALVGTGFPFKLLGELPSYLAELQAVLPACSGIRRGGSAALDLCYLSQGSLDAFWETRLDPWDIAAGLVILSEAGGIARRKSGDVMDVGIPGSVLAANSPELLEALGQRLTEAIQRQKG